MLRTLIHREWRDARVVTFASAVVAVLASVAINEWFVHYKDGAVMAVYIVPALLGLYLAVIASDIVAADVATRRIDALALLPTGMTRVWTAKVLFAFAAGAAFLAWLVAVELVVLSLGGVPEQVGAFVLALPDALPNLAFVVAGLAAVLFFSTLFDRGFAAVLAGLIVMAAAIYGWRAADWIKWEIDAGPQPAGLVAIGIAVVFLAGSAVAFVRGPAHGPTLRRALVGVAVPLGVFVPVGVGSAVALDRWLTLEPGSSDARIAAIYPSPDGKYIAMRIYKFPHYNSSYLWIARTADGHLAARPDSNLLVEGWSDDGLVRAWTYTGSNPMCNSMQSHLTLLRWIDPATADFVRTRSNEQVTSEHMAHAQAVPPRSFRKRESDGRWVVRDAATKVETSFDEMPSASLYPFTSTSPHARYASVYSKTDGWILDLVSRRIAFSDGHSRGFDWVRDCDDDRYVLIGGDGKPTRLVDLTTTPCREVVPDPGQWCNGEDIAAAPGGGFFISRAGDHVDLTDSECRTIRRVYPPDR